MLTATKIEIWCSKNQFYNNKKKINFGHMNYVKNTVPFLLRAFTIKFFFMHLVVTRQMCYVFLLL